MQKTFNYITDSHDEVKSFLNSISLNYTLSRPRKKNIDFCLFDTFDWRLYKKDIFLISQDEKFYSQSFDNKLKRIKITFKRQFLPDYVSKNDEFIRLKKIAGIRAIFIQARWDLQKNNFTVFDIKGNRICIISIEMYSFKHLNHFIIKIDPEKNFEDDVKYIQKWLKSCNINKTKTNPMIYLLNQRNLFPLQYTSKIHLESPPDTEIYLALREIFEKGRNNLLANFRLMRKDLDTEFLHDFRTTTRRLKSAITQFKKICNHDTVEMIKSQLSYLQKTTNQLRDYDVDILSMPEYKNLLSEKKHKKLDLFFRFLQTKRNAALRDFLKISDKLHINESLREINKFIFNLNKSNPNIPEKAKTPIKVEADLYLIKRIKKINAAIILLNDSSKDSEIHDLRLQFKKLRYALEFYKNYYPQRRIENFIQRIKKLQDNLGKFNDLCVQIDRLKSFRNEFKKRPIKKTSLTEVFTDLIEIKLEEKKIIRKEFFILLKRFSSNRTKESFQKMFTS